MKKIITYGTFDLFHYGHLRLLERAKGLGDILIVAVSTDEFNSLKGKKCIIPFEQRYAIIAALKCVDQVISEDSWEQKINDIHNHKIEILVMGDDWKGKFDYLNKDCIIKYLPRTENISTTIIKETFNNITI